MVTDYLLENGANPNLADHLGVTPLIAATRKGQRDVVAVLLQHGADVSPVSLEVRAIARNKNNIVLEPLLKDVLNYEHLAHFLVCWYIRLK